MGKNYSKNNTGKRNKNDFYQTPYSCTQQLLEREYFIKNKLILEPAMGKGAIYNVLMLYTGNVVGYDIANKNHNPYQDQNSFNFLIHQKKVDYIITNPPYSLANEFIQKAKEVAKEKFAMFLPLNYLQGQKRYMENVFTGIDYPLVRVYVFTRYIMLTDTIREDGKYTTGMQAYAWYVWENHCGYQEHNQPVIYWIDNNKYVLRKGE